MVGLRPGIMLSFPIIVGSIRGIVGGCLAIKGHGGASELEIGTSLYTLHILRVSR